MTDETAVGPKNPPSAGDEVARAAVLRPDESGDDLASREKQQLADNRHRDKMTDLGALGKLLGGGAEKAGNIAFIIAIACLLVVCVLLVASIFVGLEKVDAGLAGFAAIMSACLGYLFGRK